MLRCSGNAQKKTEDLVENLTETKVKIEWSNIVQKDMKETGMQREEETQTEERRKLDASIPNRENAK